MKKKKTVPIILSTLAAVPLLLFCAIGFYLTDKHISGFTGIWGIVNLRDNKFYVELTDSPLQVLLRQSDAKGDFENNYFDSWENTSHPARGFGDKDGRRYEYAFRSFTRYYFIVTLEETDILY